ncbi:S8 family serine peptidase [Halobacteria archaeon AArc-curdl1]|uniref:S8 family serine peptidase n=1 Tax=Natronosalvus hydrolyticus TaxID=2979988 RepID=A0AAP3E990_9EURY|nr:S8 family serine peptidase [Halobacteria archaeon AArc-curdl1]
MSDDGPSSHGLPSSSSVDSALLETNGTIDVVVQLERIEPGTLDTASSGRLQAQLETHAKRSQQPLLGFVDSHEGVSVTNQFWLTNAVVLEVDTDRVPIKALTRIDHVIDVHDNLEVQLLDTAQLAAGSNQPKLETVSTSQTLDGISVHSRGISTTSHGYETTYGLEQIDAPAVWGTYGTKGAGAKVAVLDTGVDPSHPDIGLYTDDDADPRYPGGWAEFDSYGQLVADSEPYDSGTHGTHVSGTVAGGNASGEYIGVAPEADLLHGLVLNEGSGTYAQIIAGMEWAVEEDADVIAMSLGADGYHEEFIEPIRNAEAAGTVVISASGNSGDGVSGSPGNSYDGMAIGASDSNAEIATFSSGEEIDTDDVWGDDAPDEWPASYIVPDVAAPGVSTKSAVPGGGYDHKSGTSMATPHVAGTAALMIAVAGDPGPETIESALVDSAWKPEDAPTEPDTRYGNGIINASKAVEAVAPDGGINGTITDTDGTPISDVTVTLETGVTTETADDGTYELSAEPGTYNVTAEGFGYVTTTETVTVESGITTQPFTLEETVDAAVVRSQPDRVESGSQFDVVLEVAGLESYTVSATTPGTDTAPTDVAFAVDGVPINESEPLEFDTYSGEVTVSVVANASATEAATLELNHTVSGANTTVTRASGSTKIWPQLHHVTVVDDGVHGDTVASALENSMPPNAVVTVATSDAVVSGDSEADAHVVQRLESENAEAYVNATESADIGVVYLDQWGDNSNGIPAYSTVTGDPETTHEDDWQTDGTEGPITYTVEKRHPIVPDRSSDETFEIYTPEYADHSWFGHSPFTPIAQVGHANDSRVGPALAVDDDGQTVLASSLGRSDFVGNEDFTAEADLILANAVSYVSATDQVTVDDSFDRYTKAGDTLRATVDVATTGNLTVDLVADSTDLEAEAIDPNKTTLFVDGEARSIGESIALESTDIATATEVRLETDGDAEGAVQLELSMGDEPARTTATTVVDTLPARYNGTVVINGNPAPDGLTIDVEGANESISSVTSDGTFGGAGSQSDALLAWAADDADLEFSVENVSTDTAVTWAADDQQEVTVHLMFEDPTANARLDGSRWTTTEQATPFSIIGIADESHILETEWNRPDHQPDDQWNATHTFSTDGHVSPSVTITDLGGNTTSLERRVLVIDGEIVTVSGAVEPAENGTAYVHPANTTWQDTQPVRNGTFEVATARNESTNIVYVQDGDNVAYPHASTLLTSPISYDTELGSHTLSGHELRVQVLDTQGDPIPNATVAFTPANTSTLDGPPVRFESTTDGEGYWQGPHGNAAGVAVNGSVTLEVTPPSGDTFVNDTVVRTPTVDNRTALTVTLESAQTDDNGTDEESGSSTPPPAPPSPPAPFTISATQIGDGSVVVTGDNANSDATADVELSEVVADGLAITHISVTVDRDRSRFAYTLSPAELQDAPLESLHEQSGISAEHRIAVGSFDADGDWQTVRSTTVSFSVPDDVRSPVTSHHDLVVYEYDHSRETWTQGTVEYTADTLELSVDGPRTYVIAIDPAALEPAKGEGDSEPETTSGDQTEADATNTAPQTNDGDGTTSPQTDGYDDEQDALDGESATDASQSGDETNPQESEHSVDHPPENSTEEADTIPGFGILLGLGALLFVSVYYRKRLQ